MPGAGTLSLDAGSLGDVESRTRARRLGFFDAVALFLKSNRSFDVALSYYTYWCSSKGM